MTNAHLNNGWRQAHLGHWLAVALQRFDARVLQLMARNDRVPLALSHLAARGSLTASHIHITRHLALEGSRLTDLAQRAGVSKQAMGKLVNQCEAWDLVQRQNDAQDARARREKARDKIHITPARRGDDAEAVECRKLREIGRERAHFLLAAEDGEKIAAPPNFARDMAESGDEAGRRRARARTPRRKG